MITFGIFFYFFQAVYILVFDLMQELDSQSKVVEWDEKNSQVTDFVGCIFILAGFLTQSKSRWNNKKCAL